MIGWAFLFVAGCSALLTAKEAAWQIAGERGFLEIRVPDPRLKGLLRLGASPRDRLTVYIEGDGAPWPWPDQPPADPTPLRQLVLQMAVSDPSEAVAYLGRPCQYQTPEELERCDPALWTGSRFGPAAIESTHRAVDALKASAGASRIALVGYSGGGAMAALVAAGRSDTDCLVTLAAPLDISAWTKAIGVSPLRGSLNPADSAGKLARIPQTHFRGKDDWLVPPATSDGFLARVPAAQVIDLGGVDHQCCWQDAWRRLRESSCLAR